MTRSTRTAVALKLAALAIAVFVALAVAPAAASAVTTWVSPEPTKAPFNSCSTPEFNSIQTAITAAAPGTEIRVCKGSYAEQLTIEKELSIVGEAGVTVKLPASPANSATSCDITKAGEEDQDLIAICGAAKVAISGVTLDAKWTGPATCGKQFYGILAGGGANLTVSESSIVHAGAEPINGCQQGVAVQIGHAANSQIATAMLSNDKISGYQKNGPTVDGKGSSATISGVTVEGAGPTPATAQNGIQVSRGALATITGSTIKGNECNVASCGNANFEKLEEDAAGVLFFEQAKGSSVTKSVINNNDLGVSHIAASGAAEAQAAISEDTLEGDRYASVMLGQGFATVNNSTMIGGSVGILVLQFAGQAFGPMGTGTTDVIKKMTKHAVEGLSDLSPSDHAGSFLITHSKIKGNPPGASTKESVFTNNPEKLPILLRAPHKKKH
jgi:hypothetical protein